MHNINQYKELPIGGIIISSNKIASTNVVLTILLFLGITYYYFYNQSPIQIERLGNVGYWLAFPLSIINILVSFKLLKNKARNTQDSL